MCGHVAPSNTECAPPRNLCFISLTTFRTYTSRWTPLSLPVQRPIFTGWRRMQLFNSPVLVHTALLCLRVT